MARSSLDSRTLWQHSHSSSILFAVLMFTASFLCVLLWTNNIVETGTSTSSVLTSTFTPMSPAVSTFTITYGVAIFGTVWNSVLFLTLVLLERDVLPISTTRLRYEVEKAACVVSGVGNAIYSIACIALMSTLIRLAAAPPPPPGGGPPPPGGSNRAAGQGVTAAMAGLAGLSAVWACFMDALHAQSSEYRRIVKDEPVSDKARTETATDA